MKIDKAKLHYYIFIALFVVLNIASTFIVTTEKLNRYIISFDYTFGGIVNSILGNAFILFLFLFIVLNIAKKPKTRLRSLLAFTLFLNTALYAINVFNRFYGTSFTFNALAIFKNPGDGFGMTLVWEALRELFTYYRIILFIPFAVLVTYYLIIRNKGLQEVEMPKITMKTNISKLIFVVLLFFVNISFFVSRASNINIVESSKATYATQNLGLYNFLLLDSMGFDYETAHKDFSETKEVLDYYNKNKEEYKNFIDNKIYTNSPVLSDVNNISGKLIEGLNQDDKVTGILKDYNMVLIHLETFNSFLLELPEIGKHFYNLNALLEQSYVFENFYTNVGLGNSFDAELAVQTGLMPNGTSTIAWDFNEELEDKNFDYQTLPKMFNERDYITNSFHGNNEGFYNRVNAHPKLFGFDLFKSKEYLLEDKETTIEEIQEKYQHESNQWITDRAMLDYLNEDITGFINNNEKFMQFLITLMPHTPYHFDPYYPNPKETDLYSEELVNSLDITTLRYLNYVKYYDEFFRILFENVNGYGDDYVYDEANLYNRKKTAFVFYGDHGSGIKNYDLNTLFGQELNQLESRQKLLKTTAFIYVPGDNIVSTTYENGRTVNFREGLLKGKQSLTRGQLDLHRTVVDLFDLPIAEDDYLFGVHGMSNEPTFSLDNKSLDYATDKFLATLKNNRLVHSLNNSLIDIDEVERIKKHIVNFKKHSDIAMNNNLYKEFKKKK